MKKRLLGLLVLIMVTLFSCVILIACGERKETHTHEYDRKDISVEYIKTEPDCERTGQYYYSCDCGKKGEKTFSFGRPYGHYFENGVCRYCQELKASEGLIYELINNDTEYKVAGLGTCKEDRIIIPRTYNGKKVTSIGDKAFFYKDIKEIIIQENVKKIGVEAFWNCNLLTSIALPESLRVIEGAAFYGCSQITEIELPSKLERIDVAAFRSCERLENILIPSSVKEICDMAFQYCDSLQSVVFQNAQGWTVWHVRYQNTPKEVDVSNPIEAATLLKSTYGEYFWERV